MYFTYHSESEQAHHRNFSHWHFSFDASDGPANVWPAPSKFGQDHVRHKLAGPSIADDFLSQKWTIVDRRLYLTGR
jgi:hypothetical protein